LKQFFKYIPGGVRWIATILNIDPGKTARLLKTNKNQSKLAFFIPGFVIQLSNKLASFTHLLRRRCGMGEKQ
jgi:hypothetical protein